MTKLLLYGLQRSGTNYLEALLTNRFKVYFVNNIDDRRSPLFKHVRIYDEKNVIPDPQYRNDISVSNFAEFEKLINTAPDYYLVISKDPYSWLVSYKNWANKCNWSAVNHHYIQEYNLFYKKWLYFSRQTEKIFFIRYIDLLENIESELHRLEKAMNLKRNCSFSFQNIRIPQVPISGEFTRERLDYYLHNRYMCEYTIDSLLEVNNLLDHEVTLSLGYRIQNNLPLESFKHVSKKQCPKYSQYE